MTQMTQSLKQPPRTEADWRALRKYSVGDLTRRGMYSFNQRGRKHEPPFDGKVLMLFPAAWFEFIPTGFHVVNVMGLKTAFNANTHSNDTRFGYLAFGVLV